MDPVFIGAWVTAAGGIIALITMIAKNAVQKGDSGPAAGYLLLDARQAEAMNANMVSLTNALGRTSRSLDEILEGQKENQRALGRNSDAAEKVQSAATELRIAMAQLERVIESIPRR